MGRAIIVTFSVILFVVTGARAAVSLGDAIDNFLDDADASLGSLTRDAFVRRMVKEGFKCKGADGPTVDVLCIKAGIGQGAKFGEDGTAESRRVILDTDDRCETALWHLEARFGKPPIKDESAKGWILSKNRFLGFYDVRSGTWRCDIMLAQYP